MADQYLNKTGLTYYHNRIKTEFENKIETVKVNGTALTPDANKAVNVVTTNVEGTVVSGGAAEMEVSKTESGETNSILINKANDGNLGVTWSKGTATETLSVASVNYVDTNGGKIDKINLNGVEQTITNKTVDLLVDTIDVATDTQTVTWTDEGEDSDDVASLAKSTNGANFAIASTTTELASVAYVDANGGKIDKIKLNGTEQTISNKTVNLIVDINDVSQASERVTWTDKGEEYDFDASLETSTNGAIFKIASTTTELVSKYYADNTFQTEAQVQQLIDDELAGITGIDFEIVTTLPASGVKGTIYLVQKTGTTGDKYDEYIWVEPTGETAHWEMIGTTEIDLSGYWAKTELTAITTAEIDTIIGA